VGAIAIKLYTPAGDLTASTKKRPKSIEEDMKGWSESSKLAVLDMIKKYGAPNEISKTMMEWHYNGQWKKTVVYAKTFEHNFPSPHKDVIEQWIEYKVPADKFSELAAFNGSVVCNRSTGEVSARCNTEEANFLSINLVNDIVNNKQKAETARDYFARATQNHINGKTPIYMKAIQFNLINGKTNFKDKPTVVESF